MSNIPSVPAFTRSGVSYRKPTDLHTWNEFAEIFFTIGSKWSSEWIYIVWCELAISRAKASDPQKTGKVFPAWVRVAKPFSGLSANVDIVCKYECLQRVLSMYKSCQ